MQFHVAFNAELFALVEAGKLDFAVCGLPDAPPTGLFFRELLATDLAVVVRTGHPLTKISRPTIHDLAAFRTAAPGVGVRARQITGERMAKLGMSDRPPAIETNSWEAILEAVASTDLYSLAPRHDAMRQGWTSRLVTIDIPELSLKHRTGVVTRVDAYLSPLASRAIELIELDLAGSVKPGPTRAAKSMAR